MDISGQVTKNGKPLDPELYTWDHENKTFYSEENGLVLGFEGMHNCTFDTGNNCDFDTGDNCTFDTGNWCIFNTGWNCTFDTGDNCTFDTTHDCTFNTGNDCDFNTGNDCTFYTTHNCTFYIGDNCDFYTGEDCTFKKINKKKDSKEKTKMKKIKSNLTKLKEDNKEAIALSAKLKAGDLIINNAKKALKKAMPTETHVYLDLPITPIILGNLINILGNFYDGPKNDLVESVSHATLTSAYHQQMNLINVNKLFETLVKGVDLTKLTKNE